MWILHQVVVLLSVISFLEAQNPPSTPNPECKGMNTAAAHLQNGLENIAKLTLASFKEAQCKPNQHCTGVKCSWLGGGSLEVDLHHCQDPVNYHVYFKAPKLGVSSKNLTLKQGDEKTLYTVKHPLISASAKIKVIQLERKNNTVTTTVSLEACSSLWPAECKTIALMDHQTLCVKMDKCPGFNASAHHYKPCSYKPSVPSTKQPAGIPTTGPSKPQASTWTNGSTGPVKTQPSPQHSSSSGPSKPQASTWTSDSTADPPSDGTFHPHKGGDGHDKKGGLSTATIIGICAAAVVAILVVVGVIVYWKKFHHRSRLRAAYYNDISMHDPLYEDFGPEVA